MQGRYKVKSPDLKPLHERAAKLARQIQYFTIEHVRRELNTDADALANVALDQGGMTGVRREGAKSEISTRHGEAQLLAAEENSEPSHQPSQRARPASPASLKIRARFLNGVLVPVESLDLPEGSEVALDVRRPLKK
jgi:hypothetical protein